MATTSFTAPRRLAGFASALLLACLCLGVEAAGQSTSSQVTSSVAQGLAAPPTYGAVWDSAVTTRGDFVIADFENAAIYQYPAGGGAPVTVFTTGSLYPGGDWANNGFAIDPWNNLWLNNNWNGGMQRVPWNPATGTWNTSGASVVANSLSIGYYQTAGFAINSSGLFAWSTENGTPGGLFEMNVDSSGNITNFVTVISKLTNRARALSIDNAGNIFIWEDGGLQGVLEVPAGMTGMADDKSLARVDPVVAGSSPAAWLLTSITGTAVDAAGNLYIGDSSAGVFMVPNQAGTLNPSAWVMITPAPASGQISIDPARDILYVPTATLWNGIKDIAAISLGSGEAGSSAVGTQSAAPITVYYSFAGPVTPANFVIQEDGVTNQDFAIVSGGSCATGTTYPIPASASANAVTSCTVNVAVNPHSAGSVSGQLLMQASSIAGSPVNNTVVATTVLHGTGLAGTIKATPAWESAIGSGLKTPSQVATDAWGNVYVADAGKKAVLMYAAGAAASAAPVSIGKGLKAPTGVAVDGAGDVFIADSGSVFEVPYGSAGLYPAGQTTLTTGLGTNLRLAADGLGHLYVADPDNARIAELYNLNGIQGASGQSQIWLTSGFTSPSCVAVDAANNLYVIDGSNLFEISNGTAATLLKTLSNATDVAVDPSGAVYVASTGGTVRIPLVSGSLDSSASAPVAPGVTNPDGLAIDPWGNVYLGDTKAGNVHIVTPNSALNFGNVPLGDQPALPVVVTNSGNAALNITGYTSTNAVDYTGASADCGAPIPAASTCTVNVTLAPGPGEQGTLVGQIGIQSDAANSPIVVNATGVGAPLAVSIASISVASSAQVVSAPVTITIKPQAGGKAPTGTVTVSVNGKPVGSGTLVNGSLTLTLSPVPAGSDTFTVAYAGDRVYGRSTATATATVAKSAIAALTLPAKIPQYVLEQNGSTPYDGSVQFWEYNFTVQVASAAGAPTGTVTFMDGSSVACPQQSGQAVQPLNPSGQATFATSCLPMPQNLTYTPIVSTHVITPVYSGDANFQSFTGQPTTFIAVRSPVVAITSVPPAISVAAGSSASANLTLTSMLGYGFAGKNQQLNDYNFPVTLACDNLPPHATCSFTYPTTVNPNQPTAPNSVQIPCSGTTAAADDCLPGTATVTVNTNVAVGTTTSQLDRPAPVTFAVMFGFGLIGLVFRRRLGQKGRLLLIFSMTILSGALATSLTACGTTNLSPASVLTTPKGTYQVTVTAQQVGTQTITLPTGPITIYGSQNQVSLPFTINVTVQ
jgi:sugar lactone lactonase YvrE